jgi:hypothetical protein
MSGWYFYTKAIAHMHSNRNYVFGGFGMSFAITGNYILDFAAIQALTILYLSEAVLPVVKWQDSDDPLVRKMARPPAAAVYEKAGGSRLRMLPYAAKPSLKATGLSIQVLSRFADILPKYGSIEHPLFSRPDLAREWKAIAQLQLEFCLEYIRDNAYTIEELSSVLEGGVHLIQAGLSRNEEQDLSTELNALLHTIIEDTDIHAASTMDLACAVRAVCAWHTANHYQGRDDFLTSAALEILNRRSRSGLFHYGPDGYASAPMGQQFFLLDALLVSYPFVMLDNVLEDVFALFSSLYHISYKEAYDLFSFKRKNINYTAFDTGAVLSCLDNISRYASDTMEQRETIDQVKDSFLDFLIDSYQQAHERDVRRLLRYAFLVREGKARMDRKPDIRTVFPKRVQFIYPGPIVNWNHKGVISQDGILFLCTCLLNMIEDGAKTEAADTGSMPLNLPALEAFRMLFDLLSPEFDV